MVTTGIDIGSSAIKIVFVENGGIIWSGSHPSNSFSAGICETLFNQGLGELSLSAEDVGGIATSGYGKSLFKLPAKKVNEISANAMGAHMASQGRARTVINIGGQDVKIIRLDGNGKVVDFKMNDKCAAGTGRFFEMSERILGIPLGEFGPRSMQSTTPALINSTCAVFAETELISLMNSGNGTADIISGLHLSIANRIASLSAALDMADEIYFDGGPALNQGLHRSIAEELQEEVKVLPQPQFTVAYGAAIMVAAEKGYSCAILK